jgi:hypothetical protein
VRERRGSSPHTSFKNSLCRESRLALPLSRRRSRGCAAALVLLRSSLTAERPSRETGCKSYRGMYRRYLGRIGQPCSILRSRSKATRELSSIRWCLDAEGPGKQRVAVALRDKNARETYDEPSARLVIGKDTIRRVRFLAQIGPLCRENIMRDSRDQRMHYVLFVFYVCRF